MSTQANTVAKRRKAKAKSIKPSDEVLAFTFLGGMFTTIVVAAATKSLFALIGGTILTVGAIRLAVGDSDETDDE